MIRFDGLLTGARASRHPESTMRGGARRLGLLMASTDTATFEAVLRRDRALVVAALVAVITITWIWILLGAGTGMTAMDMALRSGMPGMAGMMVPAAWTLGYAGLMFVMWWAMMAAMMLPSAAPILLLFARVNRNQKAGGRSFVPTGDFRCRVFGSLGRFQRHRDGVAMGIAAAWFADTDDGDHRLLTRQRHPARRRRVAVDSH
jgi:hypothetical protein